MYKINHIHIKSTDPEKDANWFVNAFNFEIISDEVRSVGDRFIIRTYSPVRTIAGGVIIEIPDNND